MHIIIFTQHDAVHVRHTCSPYFSQTTIVKKGGENKLSNEIGCIIEYQHVHMFKETSNFTRYFLLLLLLSIVQSCYLWNVLFVLYKKKMLKA